MSNLFLHLLNISITAGWIVLVVVLLRFVLKKAPKWIRVVLWGLVALRLMLPVSIESALSLVPSAETVKIEPVTAPVFASVRDSNGSSYFFEDVQGERIMLQSGFSALNSAVNPTPAEAAEHFDTVAVLKSGAGWVWLAGVCGMLLYALISFLRLRHRVRASVLLEKGVYVCDEISDPFILGLIVPKIYLPSGMDEQTRAYVLSHERAHLRRFDFIWKPLGFLLLAVYWFNPLLWLAYILLCRDIELSCDEKVVKELDDAGKAAYSEALVHASVSRRMVSACPLAFGETGVKSRVKSVLNYKKPAFWIILVAILACVAVAVCFLTMPKKDKIKDLTSDGNVTVWYEDWDLESNAPDGPQSVSVDAFPGVTFRWKDDNWGDSILAEENGKTRKLFSGMPVWNVFFADVTGDGKPELCASVYFGSGIVDEHIVVYDYVNKQSYVLWDRGTFDYHLSLDDGALQVIKRIFNTSILPTDNGAFGELVMEDGLLCCHWRNDGSSAPLIHELHESEIVGEWLVEEERDANDNVIYTRSLDLWKEYNFRNDGTVTYNETVPISSDFEKAFGHPVEYSYEVYDDHVFIEDGRSASAYLDPQTGKLKLNYQPSPGQYVYATLKRMGENLPETDAQASPQPANSSDLSQEQADAFVNGLSVEFEDGAPYGCDLVCYIDGFGKCLNIDDPEAYKSASLRFEPTEERIKPTYPRFTYAKILCVGDREYYLGNIRISKSDDQMQKYEFWDNDRSGIDASIFVPVDSSMMERNRACPERVCVIKAFDAEKREVTISFAELDEPEEDGYPATVNYDAVEEETYTFRVTDDTMLSLIVDYQAIVKPDRFFKYLEAFGWMYLYTDSDDPGVGFWIGIDGDTLLYLCEVNEE